MNAIIEAVRNADVTLQLRLQEQPSLLKEGSYEIALLQAALRTALGDEAEAVLDEIWNLTAKAASKVDF